MSGTVLTTASIWATTAGSMDAAGASVDCGDDDPSADGAVDSDATGVGDADALRKWPTAANWGPFATFVRCGGFGDGCGASSRYHAAAATIETISSATMNSAHTLTRRRSGDWGGAGTVGCQAGGFRLARCQLGAPGCCEMVACHGGGVDSTGTERPFGGEFTGRATRRLCQS